MSKIFIKNITFLGLLIAFISCNNKPNHFEKNVHWEKFKINLDKNNIDYLIKNSFDSIKCVDCVPNETESLSSSIYIFKNYKNKFYNKDLLDKKEYSVYQDDLMIRINYGFEENYGNESHNIIYMFDKTEGNFLLTGMITIP
ncbi:hypothetical protein [Polaribacter sp. SA4-12]|uniref:hypothetical protein n=1 Tax=Polaribacter sp. SA4-12 TaxID=1312072 RepID=UPI000B3C8190|nr:hypothetical protein [Polaribacter sp. SA4-12]ARV14736.1 hypothetical protein BTO07_06050 [Polaribacter sp. SA4-12]